MALIERYVTVAGGGDNSGSSFANAWSFTDAVSNYTAGMRINVVEDTYTLGATDLNVSSTASKPIVWRGRNATDDGDGRPLLNMQTNTLTISGEYQQFMNFDITSSNSSYTLLLNGDGSLSYKCKVYNTGEESGTCSGIATTDTSVVNCLISSTNTNLLGYTITSNNSFISGCKIVTNSNGIKTTNASKTNNIINSVIIGNGINNGIYNVDMSTITCPMACTNLTIYNFNNGIVFDQLQPIATALTTVIQNCLFHSCIETNPSFYDGYGIFSEFNTDNSLISTISLLNNAYYNCSNGLHNLGDNPDTSTIECTDDPFANISADDYSLNNSPNGGALLRGTVASPAYNWS